MHATEPDELVHASEAAELEARRQHRHALGVVVRD
jgi:hypothetical protein